MNIKVNHQKYAENKLEAVQAELLETLLSVEEVTYPWNPSEPESEAYFAELEASFDLSPWSDDEINQRSHNLFSQLNQCWTSESSESEQLKLNLYHKFASVPQAWLEAIAKQAKQVFVSSESLVDQLVECVRPLLPQWEADDLQVLARPLAYAMRGNTVDATTEEMATIDWTKLSEIERARLSIAIARFALEQVKAQGSI